MAKHSCIFQSYKKAQSTLIHHFFRSSRGKKNAIIFKGTCSLKPSPSIPIYRSYFFLSSFPLLPGPPAIAYIFYVSLKKVRDALFLVYFWVNWESYNKHEIKIKMDQMVTCRINFVYLHATKQNTFVLSDWANSTPRNIMDRATCY